MIFEYFAFITAISVFVFSFDKLLSRSKIRVPEVILHFFELCGGVFGIVLAMYFIHHKNKKPKYYLITHIILTIWMFLLFGIFILKFM